jgi:hypothetical protein
MKTPLSSEFNGVKCSRNYSGPKPLSLMFL